MVQTENLWWAFALYAVLVLGFFLGKLTRPDLEYVVYKKFEEQAVQKMEKEREKEEQEQEKEEEEKRKIDVEEKDQDLRKMERNKERERQDEDKRERQEKEEREREEKKERERQEDEERERKEKKVRERQEKEQKGKEKERQEKEERERQGKRESREKERQEKEKEWQQKEESSRQGKEKKERERQEKERQERERQERQERETEEKRETRKSEGRNGGERGGRESGGSWGYTGSGGYLSFGYQTTEQRDKAIHEIQEALDKYLKERSSILSEKEPVSIFTSAPSLGFFAPLKKQNEQPQALFFSKDHKEKNQEIRVSENLVHEAKEEVDKQKKEESSTFLSTFNTGNTFPLGAASTFSLAKSDVFFGVPPEKVEKQEPNVGFSLNLAKPTGTTKEEKETEAVCTELNPGSASICSTCMVPRIIKKEEKKEEKKEVDRGEKGEVVQLGLPKARTKRY